MLYMLLIILIGVYYFGTFSDGIASLQVTSEGGRSANRVEDKIIGGGQKIHTNYNEIILLISHSVVYYFLPFIQLTILQD